MSDYSTDCECNIPYCNCNAYQHASASATCHCDGCAEPESNHDVAGPLHNCGRRDRVQDHLTTLLNEMWLIREWEEHNKQTVNLITYSKYIALKLTQQEIIAYMQVFNECACCSRHTGCNYLPDLPKRAEGVGQHEEPTACYCNCRHELRHLFEALAIVLQKNSKNKRKRKKPKKQNKK
jgi:hypothetical protein